MKFTKGEAEALAFWTTGEAHEVTLLADPGSFQEMGKLQGQGTYDAEGNLTGFTPSAQVSGLAKVNGRRVFVSGSDFTIRGGSGHKDDGGVGGDPIDTQPVESALT